VPRLSRWFVRASLIYLVLGFGAGGALLTEKGLPLHPVVWRLFPAHVEFLLVGWTVQFAMGVAFWILPRFAGGASRGNEGPAWCAFVLLNAGVLGAGLGSTLGAPPSIVLWGRIAEAGGAVAFAFHAWLRVKRPSAL
jgi:hypothetical protein